MMAFDTDIADVECVHAQTRDMCLARASAWVPSLEVIAAKFCARFSNFARFHEVDAGAGSSKKPKTKTSKGGGAWRAYVHHCLQGKQFTADSIKKLAQLYANLSVEERAVFANAGHVATIAHRRGLPSFPKAPASTLPVPLTDKFQPEVGTILPGNIIVAADLAPLSMYDMARQDIAVRYEDPTFEAAYFQLKQQLRQDDLAPMERECEVQKQLAEYACQVDAAPMASQASSLGPLANSKQFERTPVSTAGLSAVQWLPDLSEAVQASCFEGSVTAPSNSDFRIGSGKGLVCFRTYCLPVATEVFISIQGRWSLLGRVLGFSSCCWVGFRTSPRHMECFCTDVCFIIVQSDLILEFNKNGGCLSICFVAWCF